ncbi:ABC transporter substrate-binding protein [Paenibacillus sp. P96]|uniref:ABC transporter substrate-binding protein n=1 Tax=Paenibacillus zeirhizosphaerae TaxID=2987519 RepID=A0ABT9FR18_9BACL|nr:ABC transporter substrate-binding protein [Paenibacillus sp. P96]MDP4097174.1 ABC transporter substrate-binding protein [Paenibacillus sp. P96]
MNKQAILASSFVLLLMAGCGAASDSGARTSTHAQAATITVTDFAGREVTVPYPPARIIALSNGDMDIVNALGGNLVGRPTSEAETELSHIEEVGTTHELDLEKITFLRPDIVLGNAVLNAKDASMIESIGSQMVLTEANSVSDIQAQTRLLGKILDQSAKAEELVQTIDAKILEMQNSKLASQPRVLMIYGAPGTYLAALPNSLSGDLLELAGGVNIASDYPELDSYPHYAQLNTERIVEADPQLILIMTHGQPEAVKDGFFKEMQVNAAWNGITAVKNGQVHVLPSDLFGTNPGTKVTKALDELHALLKDVN